MPLLLFAILGMRTAFMPSFELCMVLCFSVATAAAGYTFRNVTLREYLGPEAISGRARPWGLRGHTPTLPGGPSQLHAPKAMALARPELDQDQAPDLVASQMAGSDRVGSSPASASACFQLQSGPGTVRLLPGADGSCRTCL